MLDFDVFRDGAGLIAIAIAGLIAAACLFAVIELRRERYRNDLLSLQVRRAARSSESTAIADRRREIEANVELQDARERITDLTAINSELQHKINRLTAAGETRKAALAKATQAARVANIARGADRRAEAAVDADHRRNTTLAALAGAGLKPPKGI